MDISGNSGLRPCQGPEADACWVVGALKRPAGWSRGNEGALGGKVRRWPASQTSSGLVFHSKWGGGPLGGCCAEAGLG